MTKEQRCRRCTGTGEIRSERFSIMVPCPDCHGKRPIGAPVSVFIMKASEHGFQDGDHLVIAGHEYSAAEVLGWSADLERVQTELDEVARKYGRLVCAVRHYIANGGSTSPLQQIICDGASI